MADWGGGGEHGQAGPCSTLKVCVKNVGGSHERIRS